MKVGASLTTIALLWGAGAASSLADEAEDTQVSRQLNVQVTVRLNYLLYLPADYDEKSSWPLVLFLHGGGERGDDLEQVKKHGIPKMIAAGKSFPFIAVSPQCPRGKFWEPLELIALLDEVSAQYHVDRDRIYLTGISLGGFGTWRLAGYAANRFAAILPICGGGELSYCRNISPIPTWVFHGAKDPVVPLERSQSMVDAIKTAGGNPKFTIYPDGLHNVWNETYNNPEVIDWMLQQNRKDRPSLK